MGKRNADDNGQLERHNPGILFVEPRAQPEEEILKESSRSREEAQHECRLARTNTEPSPGDHVMGMGVGRGLGFGGLVVLADASNSRPAWQLNFCLTMSK